MKSTGVQSFITHRTCSSKALALSFPPCFSVLIFSPATRSLFSYSLTLAAHLSSACPARPCISANFASRDASALLARAARRSAASARSVKERNCVESDDDEPALSDATCCDSSALWACRQRVQEDTESTADLDSVQLALLGRVPGSPLDLRSLQLLHRSLKVIQRTPLCVELSPE